MPEGGLGSNNVVGVTLCIGGADLNDEHCA